MDTDTPESDSQICHQSYVTKEFARTLERQRNFANTRADQAELRMIRAKRERDKAWAALQEVRELFKDDASFGAVLDTLFAKPLEAAQTEIARLQSLENVKCPPTGATEKEVES